MSRWRWALVPAAVAVASRAFSIAVMAIESAVRHGVPNLLSTWDGSWYLRIAAGGYHAELVENGHHDFAFFPAWPLLIRVLSLDGRLPPDIVAIIAANMMFVVGALLVWRVIADRFDREVATGAVSLLAFGPSAFVFSMAYAESLFLVAIAGSLLASRPATIAILAAIGSATRLAGLAVGGAAAVVAWGSDPSRRRALTAAMAGSAIGFAVWFIAVAILTGDPFGFFEGSSSWIHGSVLRRFMTELRSHPIEQLLKFAFVAVVGVGALWAFRHDRELGILGLLIVSIGVVSLVAIPPGSVARYVTPAFPAYAGLAHRFGRSGTIAVAITFALGQILFAAWTIGPGRIPP